MLNKYRRGASRSDVIQACDWLKNEIINKKRDLAFIGRTCDAVDHACQLLSDVIVVDPPRTTPWRGGSCQLCIIVFSAYVSTLIIDLLVKLLQYTYTRWTCTQVNIVCMVFTVAIQRRTSMSVKHWRLFWPCHMCLSWRTTPIVSPPCSLGTAY